MTKRGFNIFIEQEYVDILEEFGRLKHCVDEYGRVNKTEAFRVAMMEIENKCLNVSVPAVENIISDKNTLESASTANKKKNGVSWKPADSRTP